MGGVDHHVQQLGHHHPPPEITPGQCWPSLSVAVHLRYSFTELLFPHCSYCRVSVVAVFCCSPAVSIYPSWLAATCSNCSCLENVIITLQIVPFSALSVFFSVSPDPVAEMLTEMLKPAYMSLIAVKNQHKHTYIR